MVIKWSDNIQIGRFPQWRIFYILKLVANQKRHSFGDVHTVKKKLFPKPECHLSPGVLKMLTEIHLMVIYVKIILK